MKRKTEEPDNLIREGRGIENEKEEGREEKKRRKEKEPDK